MIYTLTFAAALLCQSPPARDWHPEPGVVYTHPDGRARLVLEAWPSTVVWCYWPDNGHT